MSTFGLLAQIKVKRENFSGWELENLLPIKIGMLANQITFSKFGITTISLMKKPSNLAVFHKKIKLK